MRIIIDGYNFIGALRRLNPGLENLREALISELEEYASSSRKKVVVVFDGGSDAYQPKRTRKGVKVLFSLSGVKADDVIIELCRQYSSCLVVTNDAYIRKAIESYNSFAISCEEFDAIMKEEMQKGQEENNIEDFSLKEEELPVPQPKKGNPKRLSKKERRRLRLLEKL